MSTLLSGSLFKCLWVTPISPPCPKAQGIPQDSSYSSSLQKGKPRHRTGLWTSCALQVQVHSCPYPQSLSVSHEASGQGECGQCSTRKETHRFYLHVGKSAERRAGVRPGLNLGRFPQQPLDPAEAPLPRAAGMRLGSPDFPKRRQGWDQGWRDGTRGSTIIREPSLPLPTALPACPRLLTHHTHMFALHTHAHPHTPLQVYVHSFHLTPPLLSTQLCPAMLRSPRESSVPSHNFEDRPPFALACLGSF